MLSGFVPEPNLENIAINALGPGRKPGLAPAPAPAYGFYPTEMPVDRESLASI